MITIAEYLDLVKSGNWEKMTTRLDYMKWDEISEKNQQEIKKLYLQIESFLDNTFLNSREKSLAITKLEESWMWVGKAIKVDQEKRNP